MVEPAQECRCADRESGDVLVAVLLLPCAGGHTAFDEPVRLRFGVYAQIVVVAQREEQRVGAAELAPRVRVNAVAPAVVGSHRTALTRHYPVLASSPAFPTAAWLMPTSWLR